MNETLTHDDQTDVMPTSTGLEEVVEKAKQTYRSVVSHLTDRSPEQEPSIPEVAPPTSAVPTPEQRERAQHEAWLAGLSDPERRAYEAYKQRGLAADERELRDVLRAAMSLHPNRETAAEVIRDLRAPLGQADAARGPDVQPEQELPTFSKLGIDSDLANESAYQQAYGRLESLQRAVLDTRRRDEATYKAFGLPELPKDSPRRKLLGQAVAPVRGIALTAQGWAAMGRVDERVYRIRANIIDDPLWIAADYLDRTTSLEKLEHRVLEDPAVQRAKGEYKKAEQRVREAARALDTYEPQTRWKRLRDTVQGRGQDEPERLRALHGSMKEASLGLNHAKRALDTAEREARDAALALNAEALEIQREARERRDQLEQPLREALIDRHIAERALVGHSAPHHLREAGDLGSLTYVGEHKLGGFAYHEFTTFSGGVYLADSVELRGTLDKLKLERGDRVVLRSDERGARHLAIEERADPTRGLSFGKGKLVEKFVGPARDDEGRGR